MENNIIYAFGGNKMPNLNPKDKQSIKDWQDWAVKNNYMTQEQVNTGYGIYGPKTQVAYNKAINDKKSTNNKKTNNERKGPVITKLSLDEAKNKYTNAGIFDGTISVIDDALFHILAPRFFNLGTNRATKKQIAAIIGYNGMPKPGTQVKIDYGDYGKMTGQSSNPNTQSPKDNAAGKTVGLAQYKLSPNGRAIEVIDDYDFHTERIPIRNASGDIISWKTYYDSGYLDGTKDAGWGTALKGLYEDIVENKMLTTSYKPYGKTVSFLKRLEHLGENFGTRQGKTRNSSFTLPIWLINRWNK